LLSEFYKAQYGLTGSFRRTGLTDRRLYNDPEQDFSETKYMDWFSRDTVEFIHNLIQSSTSREKSVKNRSLRLIPLTQATTTTTTFYLSKLFDLLCGPDRGITAAGSDRRLIPKSKTRGREPT
jgi:hypothetical protein